MNNLNDKMTLSTPDGAERNTALLTEWVAQTFPNCITEGKVDFDLLRQECSSEIIDGAKERYRLEWSGKRNAIVTANLASDKTLRPIREDSKDFDTTENLYIEGDNLEVLKLMQESYLNQIKMIYIDPPYNTGNEFVYNDNFSKEERESLIEQGIIDEDGNILTSDKNGQDKPRYHSDWLTFMYPRLKLARNLLTDDGVIFISIDDNEVHNLRKICDEVFGETNLITQIAWRRTDNQSNIGMTARVKEYILTYAKNIKKVGFYKLPLSEKAKKEYQYRDEKGLYGRGQIREAVRGRYQYDVVTPKGFVCKGPWLISQDEFNKLIEKDLIHWPDKDGGTPRRKIYLKDMIDQGQIPNDFWGIEFGTNQRACSEVDSLFNKRYFDFPKPVLLLYNLLKLGSRKDVVILDFFSGSATTAHAVMQMNAEDGGKRKFILVQLPEKTDEKSEAYKAGYKNICEIGKERIRRAGKAIKDANPLTTQNLDTGFKVLRLDESNIKNVMRKPGELTQGELNFNGSNNVVENLKEGRSDEDLIYQVLITWGLPLTLPIVKAEMCGKTVYKVDGNALYCCFEDGVTRVLAEALAHEKPMRVLFADRSFKDDNEKENVKQTLRQISPETEMRVL
ncbi:MAG: site-specific DNA-methyltransferase [Bacteroidaceae bacterium]|nr:site-specific DNA-methyltransferase [Bacteroidaceae bacterium]